MHDFIYALARLLPWPLSQGAGWIADRIYGVFLDAVRFAQWVGTAFSRFPEAVRLFIYYLHHIFTDIYNTLRWFLLIRMPQYVMSAVNTLRRWAISALDALSRTLRSIISTLDRWARATLATLSNAFVAFRNWALGKVNQLIANVTQLFRRVFDLWATPARLATWILSALITLMWQYIYVQRDRIARWFLRSSPAFTRWLAVELDKVLARLI